MRADGWVFFELRSGGGASSTHPTRIVLNRGDLISHAHSDPHLGPTRVLFASLRTMPVWKQLALLGAARGLAGVHGGSLAHVVFLRSDGGSSLLEIRMNAMHTRGSHASLDYPRLAKMNNVTYLLLDRQEDAPECIAQVGTRMVPYLFRECGNLTVDLEKTVGLLRRMLALAAPFGAG